LPEISGLKFCQPFHYLCSEQDAVVGLKSLTIKSGAKRLVSAYQNDYRKTGERLWISGRLKEKHP